MVFRKKLFDSTQEWDLWWGHHWERRWSSL